MSTKPIRFQIYEIVEIERVLAFKLPGRLAFKFSADEKERRRQVKASLPKFGRVYFFEVDGAGEIRCVDDALDTEGTYKGACKWEPIELAEAETLSEDFRRKQWTRYFRATKDVHEIHEKHTGEQDTNRG